MSWWLYSESHSGSVVNPVTYVHEYGPPPGEEIAAYDNKAEQYWSTEKDRRESSKIC